MNKKLIRILTLVLAIVLLGASAVFADTESSAAFALIETSPENGSTNTVAQNVAVKLIFNRDVSQESARTANDGIFTITTVNTDKDGTETPYTVPYTALYNNAKYPNEVWLQCDEDLITTQTYTVTIPGKMVSSDGETLGADETLSFTIRNTKRDNTIYTILMLVFMAVMMFLSVRDAARQARGDAKQQKKDVSVNPYKEAKKKGKTVAEVNAETAKKKAKIEEKEARKAAMKEQIRREIEEERKKARERSRKKKYRVMKAAPISKAGYKVSDSYLKSIHKK